MTLNWMIRWLIRNQTNSKVPESSSKHISMHKVDKWLTLLSIFQIKDSQYGTPCSAWKLGSVIDPIRMFEPPVLQECIMNILIPILHK